MKIILVLLDGVGDRSYKVLDNRTPLQSAHTPNLDRLARLGSNGLFHASRPGRCLPSETAHYFLFGYDTERFPGRGLLEAVGHDVIFRDEDVLSLAHLSGVCWEKNVPILHQGRKDIGADESGLGTLYHAIRDYETGCIRFRLERTRPNDAILVMSGDVSPFISDADPMVTGMPLARVLPLTESPEPARSGRTARALNEYLSWCHRVLTDHEANRTRAAKGLPQANFLVTQRCGRRIQQEPFEQKWGLRGMFIASGAVFKGLARELGLDFVRAEDSDAPGEDLRERIGLALADDTHGFIHVHTKVPDEAAHKGNPAGKAAAIEALDRGMSDLVAALESRDDLVVAVTADHSTPTVSALIHSGEPVPLTIAGPNVRRDGVKSFDEISAAPGCLGLLRGRELMLVLLNYADRSVLIGHRLGSIERPSVPEDYEAFRLEEIPS